MSTRLPLSFSKAAMSSLIHSSGVISRGRETFMDLFAFRKVESRGYSSESKRLRFDRSWQSPQ
jgi:hypothetical protein